MNKLLIISLLLFPGCASNLTSSLKEKRASCFIDEAALRSISKQYNHQFLDNKYYDAIYDNSRVQPFLVEYKLQYSKATHTLERGTDFPDTFIADQRVELSATNRDYLRTGWDKGHLAPAEDFSFAIEAAKETFLFSNISPQKPNFNRHGSWVKLEKSTRALSSEFKLQVITGPLEFSNGRMPSSTHAPLIPKSFYKILIYEKSEQCFYESFTLQNSTDSNEYCGDNQSSIPPIFLRNHLSTKLKGKELCHE